MITINLTHHPSSAHKESYLAGLIGLLLKIQRQASNQMLFLRLALSLLLAIPLLQKWREKMCKMHTAFNFIFALLTVQPYSTLLRGATI